MRAVNAPSQLVRAKPVPSATWRSTMLSAASARTPSSSGKRGCPGGGATFGAGALTVRAAYGRRERPYAWRAPMHVAAPAPPDPLAAAGVGVWSLVIGPAAGNLAGVAAAIRASPYRLALRWDRSTARRYLRFSAWVLLAAAAAPV